jgi:hypothetical protein
MSTLLSLLSFNNTLYALAAFETRHFTLFSVPAFENRPLKYAILACIDAVDKKYREKEHDANRDASSGYFAYKGYMANNGVDPLMMKREQADYLDTFSPDAQLFYLAFAFVDGTDGIANGIARHILSYVGRNKSEDEDDGE